MKFVPKIFQKKAVKKVRRGRPGIMTRGPRTAHLGQPPRAIPRYLKAAGGRVYKRHNGEVIYEAIQVKPKGNKMCSNCLIRPRQNGSSRCKGCAKEGHGK